MFELRSNRTGTKDPANQVRQWHATALPRTALAAAGLVALLLTACAPQLGGGSGGLAKNQVFVWPYAGQAKINYDEVLDPATITYAVDQSTASMIYTSLVTFDSNLGVKADAALKWDIDTTGTIYTFHLRPNMHFSDGTPLGAADFAYSIDRALDPKLCTVADAKTYGPSGPLGDGAQCTAVYSADPASDVPPIAATYLGYILGASERASGTPGSLVSQGDDVHHGLNVLDAQTLRIRLKAPIAYFLEALTYPTAYPVERKLVEDPKNAGGFWVDHLDQGGCSGPFMVKSYGGGKQFSLVPNPYWEAAWGKQLQLTEVDRPMVADQSVEYTNYQNGQYDYTVVPLTNFQFAVGQDDFNEVPTLLMYYFGLNWDKPPFDNLLVRRAFSLSLNKQILVDRITNGGGIPTNHIVPRGMPGFTADLTTPPPDRTQSLTGNQKLATDLLTQARQGCSGPEAGWPDYCAFIMKEQNSEPITFSVRSNSDTGAQFVTKAAQYWTTVLNLNVQSAQVDYRTYSGNVRPHGPYQAWYIGWAADYPDPQDWLTLQFADGANNPLNSTDLNQPDLSNLLHQADKEQDQAKRMADYNKAEQAITDQVAWIPLYQAKTYWRQRSWVHGFSQNALGIMVDINWPDVKITAH